MRAACAVLPADGTDVDDRLAHAHQAGHDPEEGAAVDQLGGAGGILARGNDHRGARRCAAALVADDVGDVAGADSEFDHMEHL